MKRILPLLLVVLFYGLTGNAVANGDKNKHFSHAATLWWVIFNNPDGCTTNPAAVEKCGPPDVFGTAYLESVVAGEPNPALISPTPEADIGVIYATGATTDPKNGRIRLAASIYRSPDAALDLTGAKVVDPLGLGRGLVNLGAEVHLVVRDHGRVVEEGLNEQLTNFLEPFCSDPLLLFEGGDNLCRDLHTAVYAGGESGQDVVISFADGLAVPEAQANLVRQGDMIQALVETRIPDRRKRGNGQGN